jgi:hypothetical protein
LIRKFFDGSRVFMGSFLSVDFGGLKNQIGYEVGKNKQTEDQGVVNPPGGDNAPLVRWCAEREDDFIFEIHIYRDEFGEN